jgi:TRAP-type C4-dicarboxylate transport system substrate-binding protein
MFVVMNKKKWDKLSDLDQSAISSVSGEALAKLAGIAWDKADQNGINISKNNGVELVSLTKDDKLLVKNLLTPIIESTLNKISKEKNIDAHKIYSELLKEIEFIKMNNK